MRRMKVEICAGGGKVVTNLTHATHVVIMCTSQSGVEFNTLLNGFSAAEKRLLQQRRLHIVKSQWLEDCFERNAKLPEESYSLKLQGVQELVIEDCNEMDVSGEENHSMDIVPKQALFSGKKDGEESRAIPCKPRVVSLPRVDAKRKRGRPPSGANTKRGKLVVSQSRRTRPRGGNKPAKIYEDESNEDDTSRDDEVVGVCNVGHRRDKMDKCEGQTVSDVPKITRAHIRNQSQDIGGDESEAVAPSGEQTTKQDAQVSRTNDGPEFQEELADFTSKRGKAVELGIAERDKPGQWLNEINEAGSGQGSSRQYNNRSGDTVDPVQAMLFNMVPILATQKAETANPPVHEDHNKEEKLPFDAEKELVKKKKVSYKDIANELLKDW